MIPARNKLKKGLTSISLPEEMMLSMTAEDEFASNQRAMNILNMRDMRASDLPPPLKFSPMSSAHNRISRAQSVDSINNKSAYLLKNRCLQDNRPKVWIVHVFSLREFDSSPFLNIDFSLQDDGFVTYVRIVSIAEGLQFAVPLGISD